MELAGSGRQTHVYLTSICYCQHLGPELQGLYPSLSQDSPFPLKNSATFSLPWALYLRSGVQVKRTIWKLCQSSFSLPLGAMISSKCPETMDPGPLPLARIWFHDYINKPFTWTLFGMMEMDFATGFHSWCLVKWLILSCSGNNNDSIVCKAQEREVYTHTHTSRTLLVGNIYAHTHTHVRCVETQPHMFLTGYGTKIYIASRSSELLVLMKDQSKIALHFLVIKINSFLHYSFLSNMVIPPFDLLW